MGLSHVRNAFGVPNADQSGFTARIYIRSLERLSSLKRMLRDAALDAAALVA
jgi:hypothetical protein